MPHEVRSSPPAAALHGGVGGCRARTRPVTGGMPSGASCRGGGSDLIRGAAAVRPLRIPAGTAGVFSIGATPPLFCRRVRFGPFGAAGGVRTGSLHGSSRLRRARRFGARCPYSSRCSAPSSGGRTAVHGQDPVAARDLPRRTAVAPARSAGRGPRRPCPYRPCGRAHEGGRKEPRTPAREMDDRAP